MKKDTLIALASLAGSILTIGSTLLNDYASEQKLDAKIDKKVAEALKKLAETKDQA